MRKPEEYLEMAITLHCDEYDSPYCDVMVYDGRVKEVLEAIKFAQIEAIQETVQKCIEKAELKEFKTTPQDRGSISNYMGDVYAIDLEGIASVADELIKEL
jgi:hypothetical protein